MLWNMQEAMIYGTHIVLDGFRADPQALGDSDMVREVLEGLGRTLESETEAYIQVFGFDNGPSPGSSGAATLQESGLALHLFPDASKLTLRVFSRHNVGLGEVTALLSSRYGVGRFETQIRTTYPPRREDAAPHPLRRQNLRSPAARGLPPNGLVRES